MKNTGHKYLIFTLAGRRYALDLSQVAEVNEPPSQFDRPIGCPYARRCSIASARCAERKPELREVAPGRLAACHNV